MRWNDFYVGTGTLDEAPGAYKPARIIEEAIGPTATIIGRIKPILNMKDSKGDEGTVGEALINLTLNQEQR